VEDVDSQYGTNRWVITRRAAFSGSTDYVTGKKYIVQAANANTGTVMVSIGTEPDRPLLDADGNELVAGEITAGRYYTIRCGAANTRNYRIVASTTTEKQRLAVIERTGLIQLTNVSGTGTTITGEPFGVVGPVSDVTTGMLFSLVANAANAGRSVTLRIGDNGARLPVRAVDGTPLRVGALKADHLYVLRRYGPAATDPHYRVVLGVDPVASSGGGALPDPVDEFEIAVPGDYPNIQAAFDAALWVRAKTINIVIANGHRLTKGLRADGSGTAHIRITYAGTGAVKLAAGFVGASNLDVDPMLLSAVYRSAGNVFVFNRGSAPTIACLIDMEGRDGNGYVGVNTQSQINPGCGVINAGRAGFVQQGGQVYALYSKWDGAGGEGIRCQQAASPSFQGASADDCQSVPAISTLTSLAAAYFSRATHAQFQDGSARRSGGHGLGVHRGFLSATDADVSDATYRGLECSHGGEAIVNRVDFSGAGEYAIGAGADAVRVVANGANLKGAGIKSVYAVGGGHDISIWGAATNSTPGAWVRGNTHIPVIGDVSGFDFFNFPSWRGILKANVDGPLEKFRGGAVGQMPVKLSENDFDIEWQDPTGGGGGVPTSRRVDGDGTYLELGGPLSGDVVIAPTIAMIASLAKADAAAGEAATALALAGKEPIHTFVSWTSAARDLAISDNRARLRATHATPVLTIRHQADVAYVDHTLVEGSSLNAMLVQGSTDVTVNGGPGGSVLIPGQTDFRIERIAANDWVVTGKGVTGLPAVTTADNGKVAMVTAGAWVAGALPASLPAVTTADNGKVARVVDGGWVAAQAPVTGQSLYVIPEEYPGTTEEKIEACWAAALATGKTAYLGGTYDITRALAKVSVADGARFNVLLAGKINIVANIERPIVVEAVWPAPTAVTSLTSTTFVMDGGASATECIAVVSPGHGVAVDEIVKLVADDQIPGEINDQRRVGQYGRVGAVVGDTVYVAMRLLDPFTTGIRLQKVPKGADFSLTGPGQITHTPGQTWHVNALTLRGFVDALVDATIFDGYDCGLQPQSCLLSTWRVGAWGADNKINSAGISAYGVQDCCGYGNEIEIRGEGNRHCVTTGSLTTAAGGATYQYGRATALRITGACMGSTSAAVDLHSSAQDCVIDGVRVTGGSAGEDGSGAAIQLRGRRNRAVNPVVSAAAHGAQLWAQAEGDGWDLSIEGARYTGPGDAVRLGAQTAAIKLKAPRIVGGRFEISDNLRTVYVTQTDLLRWSGTEIVPTGATSGSRLIEIGANVDEIWLIGLTIDLSRFTGANYDLIGFSAGVTGTRVVLVAPSIIDPDGRLRSVVNGTGATDVEVEIIGLPDEVQVSGALAINATGVSVTVRRTGQMSLAELIALVVASNSDPDETALGAALIAAIETADPDAFSSAERTLAHIEAAAQDAEDGGPRLGNALAAAQLTMSQVAIEALLNGLYSRAGYGAALLSGVEDGDVLLAGGLIEGAANLRRIVGADSEAVIQTPNRIPHFDEDGEVEGLTYPGAALLIEAAMPFGGAGLPVIPVAGVLAYNAAANRVAKCSISANLTLDATIWDNLTGNITAYLLISTDGTARTLTVGPSDNGLIPLVGASTLPVTLAANSTYLATLNRFDRVPVLTLSPQGGVVAPATVQVVSYGSTVTGAITATLGFTTKPVHQKEDDILAIAVQAQGGTAPAHPAGFTTIPFNSGSGAPGVSLAHKVAASASEALTGWTGAERVILVVLRKLGGVPQFGDIAWWKAGGTAGGPGTVTWEEASLPSPRRGIYLGLHFLVSSDGGEMRPGIALKQTFGTSNRVMLGYSDPTTASPLEGVTTEKAGNLAKSATIVLPIY
ncbi:hypothetical protein, partial [Sphingomonas sp.]|uniref:hypothetical protein n=1 Tax=Sphingomonas sp. TaxID=28214 RepID=UPI002DD6B2CE